MDNTSVHLSDCTSKTSKLNIALYCFTRNLSSGQKPFKEYRIWETLNLCIPANSGIKTKQMKKKKCHKKNYYVSPVTTPTATTLEPSVAIPPTMHSRLVSMERMVCPGKPAFFSKSQFSFLNPNKYSKAF